MSILSLDPGLRTGWARSDGTSGVFSLAAYEDHGQAVAMWSDWLEQMLKERPLTQLAIERAWLTGGRFRHGDLTLALIRIAHALAWSVDVPRRELSAGDVRKHLIGRPRRRKDETERAFDAELAAAVKSRGFNPATPHAVDAAALLIAVADRKPRVTE